MPNMRSILYEFTPSELQALLDTSNSYGDLLRKIGLNPKGGNPATLKKIIEEYNLDETQLNKNRHNLYSQNSIIPRMKRKKSMEDILSNKAPFYFSNQLLKRLIDEGYKTYKCEECGINTWMGKPLVLQLDHIDGNHLNNSYENLKVLCPNCHSQTNTFAGKNTSRSKLNNTKKIIKIKNRISKTPPVTREELKELIRNNSMTEVGRQFGVTDNSIRKWCVKYNLPEKVSEIKRYTNEEWNAI